ncbi:MAG: triose-phosphate isomerase [Planctomycetota bacterium]
MPERTPFVGGNWKMNTASASAGDLAADVAKRAKAFDGVEVAVFPPFPYLTGVGAALGDHGSGVKLGAQDLWKDPDGAYTGEVSAAMLRDCGVETVLTGHSERRHVIGESDELVGAKTRAALDAGLLCVLCVGEQLHERETGQTDAVNERQLRAGLEGVAEDKMGKIVIAYEPVWAIGTGKVASPQDAQNAHAFIRTLLGTLYSGDTAQQMRIIYGGSMKPDNAPGLMSQPDIDGGLIGGASLKGEAFAGIIEAAAAAS